MKIKLAITNMGWVKTELYGQQESCPNPLTSLARRYFKTKKADKKEYKRDA